QPLALGGGLPLGRRSHVPLQSPPACCHRSLLGRERLDCLPQLPRDLRPGEVAAERRVRDLVVGGEPPQRLAGGSASNQLPVRNEPAKSALALHAAILAPSLSAPRTHQKRTSARAARAGLLTSQLLQHSPICRHFIVNTGFWK